MNTTLTAVHSSGSSGVGRRASLARQRFSVRVGLALVAWGRRADARLTHEAVAESRRNRAAGTLARDELFASVSLLTRQTL